MFHCQPYVWIMINITGTTITYRPQYHYGSLVLGTLGLQRFAASACRCVRLPGDGTETLGQCGMLQTWTAKSWWKDLQIFSNRFWNYFNPVLSSSFFFIFLSATLSAVWHTFILCRGAHRGHALLAWQHSARVATCHPPASHRPGIAGRTGGLEEKFSNT